MKHLVRALNVVLLVGLSAGFAVANGEERVTVELGLTTLHRVSLPLVVFLSVLLGMTLVLAAGLRADLRTRRRLRRYRDLLDRRD